MAVVVHFRDTISEAYQQRLLTFAENIIDQGITENRHPLFCFTGMDRAVHEELIKLRCAYNDQYGA